MAALRELLLLRELADSTSGRVEILARSDCRQGNLSRDSCWRESEFLSLVLEQEQVKLGLPAVLVEPGALLVRFCFPGWNRMDPVPSRAIMDADVIVQEQAA
jgi:hypothetical protein